MIDLANRHPRVNILKPGQASATLYRRRSMVHHRSREVSTKIIRAAREVNDAKPAMVFNKSKAAASRLRQPVIACPVFHTKPISTILRESPR